MKDLGTPTSRIIEKLYAGTLDDAAWKRALLDIADLVSARDALLFVINPRTRGILRAEMQRYDPGAVSEYAQHWFERDIRFMPGLRIPVGEPQFEARLLPLRDWKRSEVYCDFLRPNDSPFFLRTWLHKGPEKLASLSLQATCRRGPFDEHDAERIRPLVPHVQRALEIRDRLERAQVRADTLSTSFDSLRLGVMILDGAGRLLEANAAAQRAMRAGSAMHLDADRHLHLGGSAGADLARWIANGRPPEHLRDGLVHVARPSGRPLSVMVTRLPEMHTAWIGGDPRWMLLLFDPDARTRASAELIARDLCISEREAELAALLAAGHDLHRVAALLGITINTARAHLKAIFSKTDIHSQAELVRRVVAGPSVIGGGTPVSAPHFEALLTSLYEAALDARLWPAALQQLVAFVGTSGSHLFLLDRASGLVTQDAYYGMPEVLMSEYDTGHVLQCPRVHNARAHPERTILYDYQHTDEREIDRSDYYHWLQSRGDGIRYYLGARLSLLNDTPGFLSFAFRKSEGHAQSRHIRRVRRILPHVNRAIQIGQRLGASRIAAATYAEALARQAVGVVALDERGHVLLTHSAVDLNGGATRWLRVRSDGVRLADGAADRRLQRQIGLCQRIAAGGSGEVAQPLIVRTAVGDFRLSASPLLLRGEPLGAPQARVLLTIERLEPRGGHGRSSGDLAVERLSPAEQRVAKLLMQGCAIVVVARELGISVHTARSHLKNIYAKTGVHRQAQLVAHLMRCQSSG